VTRRAAILVAVAMVSACTGAASADPEPVVALPAGSWSLTFSDDFDGSRLGQAWNTCHWWQVDGGCTISGNDEQQWYRPEAVEVVGGALVLRATADPQVTTDGAELPYRSGMVTSGYADNDDQTIGFGFTYGYVEARVQVPSGAGTWSAVWLLSADKTSLPEIDLFETYGSRPGLMTAHVHQRVDGERSKARIEAPIIPTGDGWHTVGVLWEPSRVQFHLDGQAIGDVTDPALIPDTPMYLIVNLALGGPAGEVDASALPQQLRVDYVRVWQRGRS
jgi:beta-glucanase (GH16 family)